MTLSETAQSLHDYLDPHARTVHLPAVDYNGLSDAMKQLAIDMERMTAHADTYEEAAVIARKKARHMQRILNSYKNSLIPLVQMPPEVLALVFERCVELDTSGHALSGRSMPWVLSHTCRRWRSIILSTPSLWQILRLDTAYLQGRSHDNLLDVLQTWLERSQPLPLSCFAMLEEEEWEHFNGKVVDALIQHASRWRHVDLCFGTQRQLFHRLRKVDPYLPFLLSIRIEVILAGSPEPPGNITMQWEAPNLKEATLFIQNDSKATNPALALPWSQLEEFEWSPNIPKTFLHLPPSFDNLRYCYLRISHHVDVDILSRHTLPRLRRFDLSGSYRSIISILDRLILPILERLDTDTDEQIGPVADQVLFSIARLQLRSACQISSLSAPFSLFSSPSSPLIMEKVGTIHELRVLLSAEENNEQAFSNFLLPTMFPNLKVLHILYREPPEEVLSLFSRMVQMVESRRNPQTLRHGLRQLEKLSFDVIRLSEMPDLRISTHLAPFQRLLQLQRGGLVLLGSVVDGKWHSYYGDGGWNDEDFRRSARRWARFGYSDWFYDREVEDYLKVSGRLDSH
ncbi:hypothetical protein WG66_004478 [Moniliophthora roreri]|uniref:Uncharacterized protein n=1 Tax=Moniliophthora roreri TaxID=221103 RepID=A0A0W0FK70_MONRR|nr:hypothetical protein WG66_004478 [Moniliophthora roreri]